jgi:hypothetical protein
MTLARTSLTTRTTCRICGSPDMVSVRSLGDQCIAGVVAEPAGEQPVARQGLYEPFASAIRQGREDFVSLCRRLIVPMPQARLLSRDRSKAAS